MPSQWFKYVVSSLIVSMFLLLTWGSGDTDADTKAVKAQAPAHVVAASQLIGEYADNEVKADGKYKGKVVVVTGRVQDIGKDVMDDVYIVLGGTGFLDGVQCSFTPSEHAMVAELDKGQTVTVKGEVSGLFGNVHVEKCSLVADGDATPATPASSGGSEAKLPGATDGGSESASAAAAASGPSVTASALVKEYEDNEVKADAKYKGKVIVVEGKVQEIGKDLFDDIYVVIGGTGLLDGVQCAFGDEATDVVASLGKGDSVKIEGTVSGLLGNVQLEDCRFIR